LIVLLNVALTLAVDLAVPSGHIKKHKYPAWFSGKLNAYIKKNIIFMGVKRCLNRLFLRQIFFLPEIG
jgi:hypothetical protein